jgi:uncharacterized protein YecT (DUF1311 family)
MRGNLLSQIDEVRNRSARALLDVDVLLNEFRDEWLLLKNTSSVFVKYVPIRLYTVMEVRVRKTIQELIDHGEPFATRSKALWNKTKPDFEVLFGVQGKRVTVGELVAHSVSLNSFEQIFGVLELLLPNLEVELLAAKDRYVVEVLQGEDRPIITNFNTMKKQLQELVELRHVLVHELPNDEVFDTSKIDGYFESATQFLNAISWLSLSLREGMVALTQADMTALSFETCDIAQSDMNAAFDELMQSKLFDEDMLKDSQLHWEKSAQKDAAISASFVEGGSMHPMQFSLALADLYEGRAKYLRDLFQSHPEYQ